MNDGSSPILVAMALGLVICVGVAWGLASAESSNPVAQEKSDIGQREAAERQAALEQWISNPSGRAVKSPGLLPTGTPEPWPQGIFHDASAPYAGSEYILDDVWQQDVGGNHVQVFAGHLGLGMPDPGRGVIVVNVVSPGLQALGLGGTYLAPPSVTSLSIVGANGTLVSLLAASGETFYFDAETRAFTDAEGDPVPTDTPRPPVTPYPTLFVPTGTPEPWPQGLISSGQSTYPSSSFLFENTWQWDIEGNHVQVFAGREGNAGVEPGRGVLVVDAISMDLTPVPGWGGMYLAPAGVGSLHIVSYEAAVLTVEDIRGRTFYFNAVSRGFTGSDGEPIPTDAPLPPGATPRKPDRPWIVIPSPLPDGATPSPEPVPLTSASPQTATVVPAPGAPQGE